MSKPAKPTDAPAETSKEASGSSTSSGTIQISIRTLDGKTTKINADPSWTVRQLKEEFGKYRGQDFSRVNMHYKGKRLKDDHKIDTYQIESDGFVQANIRSEGGEGEGCALLVFERFS